MPNFKLIFALFFCAVFLPAQGYITRPGGASPAGVAGCVQTANGAVFNCDATVRERITAIADPAGAPAGSATCAGTCTTSYGYKSVVLVAGGNTLLSPELILMNASTLDGGHFNSITLPLVSDSSAACAIIRTTGPNVPLFLTFNWDVCDGSTVKVDNQPGIYGVSTLVGNSTPLISALPATNNTLGSLIFRGNQNAPSFSNYAGGIDRGGGFWGFYGGVGGDTWGIIADPFGNTLQDIITNGDGSIVTLGSAPGHGDWAFPGTAWSVKTVNAGNSPYTVTRDDGFIKCDATAGNITATLPVPSADPFFLVGRIWVVHKADATANTCTVAASMGSTIDGAATYVLGVGDESLQVYWDGGVWKSMHRSAFSHILGSATAGQLPNAGVHTGDCVGTFPAITCSFKPLRGTSGTLMGALTIGACNTTTVAVTGATTAMVVDVSPVSNPDSGATGLVRWDGYVSSANTVTVRECGLGVVTPNATAYNVAVLP